MKPFRLKDWRNREYEVEIAHVAFLGGYVVWVDDEPYLEGESFPSRRAALSEITHNISAPVATAKSGAAA